MKEHRLTEEEGRRWTVGRMLRWWDTETETKKGGKKEGEKEGGQSSAAVCGGETGKEGGGE